MSSQSNGSSGASIPLVSKLGKSFGAAGEGPKLLSSCATSRDACFGIRSLGWLLAICCLFPVAAYSEELIRLKNGMTLRGFTLPVSSMNQNPFSVAAGNGEIKSQPILLVDDQLRRTYIHRLGMVAGAPNQVPDLEQSIDFWQPVPLGGKAVGGVGSILAVSPINEFGRRTIKIRGPDGNPIAVTQGITELNARYAKLEALKSAGPSYVWDMRVSTSSIDSKTLQKIFRRRIDQASVDKRLEVVRFFIDAKRHAEAREELQAVIDDFPAQKDLAAQIIAITERQAGQLLEEAQKRAAAGQERLARRILEGFPLGQVSRITRLKVQDALDALSKPQEQIQSSVARLRGQVKTIGDGQQAALALLLDEMEAGLSSATIARLSDYLRFGRSRYDSAGKPYRTCHRRLAAGIGIWRAKPDDRYLADQGS